MKFCTMYAALVTQVPTVEAAARDAKVLAKTRNIRISQMCRNSTSATASCVDL